VNIRGVFIEDTFAEAFTMRVARLLITGRNHRWAREAALKLTGFATSVIGCKCEAAVERELPAGETPDGRPGYSVLFMTMSKDDLPKRLIERVGQTVLTCPTTACFDGLPEAPDRVGVGSALRFFGDGFQVSKVIGGERFWRIPVMEGEFLVQEKFGMVKGVGGGNFLMLARSADAALEAAEAAADTMTGMGGVILPFPGGVVRSGSKVGSRRIKSMIASTNDAFCPTLRGRVKSDVGPDTVAVLEIVIDGLSSSAVAAAMKAAIKTILATGAAKGVTRISAGNYGGKLGQHHYHLKELLP
jgi:formylmethanofuran--tetrahydromethanopterin N-formyltransferase